MKLSIASLNRSLPVIALLLSTTYCWNNFRLTSIEDPMYVAASFDVAAFEKKLEDIEFHKNAAVGLNVPTFITLCLWI